MPLFDSPSAMQESPTKPPLAMPPQRKEDRDGEAPPGIIGLAISCDMHVRQLQLPHDRVPTWK